MKINRAHLAVIGIWGIAVLSLGLFGQTLFSTNAKTQIAEMSDVREAAMKVPGIWTATVASWKTVSYVGGNQQTNQTLLVSAFADATPQSNDSLATHVAAEVLKARPDVLGQPSLTIRLSIGFDLGVVWFNRSYSLSKTPEEWRKAIEVESTPTKA